MRDEQWKALGVYVPDVAIQEPWMCMSDKRLKVDGEM